jgi:hypothetical protein
LKREGEQLAIPVVALLVPNKEDCRLKVLPLLKIAPPNTAKFDVKLHKVSIVCTPVTMVAPPFWVAWLPEKETAVPLRKLLVPLIAPPEIAGLKKLKKKG